MQSLKGFQNFFWLFQKPLKDQGLPWKNHQLFGFSIFLRTVVMNPTNHPCNPRSLFLLLMTAKHWLYPAPLPWAYMLPNVKLRLECRNWAFQRNIEILLQNMLFTWQNMPALLDPNACTSCCIVQLCESILLHILELSLLKLYPF